MSIFDMNILEQIVGQDIGPVVSNMAGQFAATLGKLPVALSLDVVPAAGWLTAGAALLLALALTVQAWRRTRRQLALVSARLEALEARATATDDLLAETTASLNQLRQRAGQIAQRPEAAVRSGLRQAIALSRHGATARQIMDTCGLSQGEVHLIHTLYGRSHQATAGADATGH
jgi:uncharacterized protein HemX